MEPDAPNNPDSKLNKVVENVAAEYFQNNVDGKIGCQLVFSDIGTPKATWSEDWKELFKQGERTFDVYNYIKTELVKKGIPAEEIAFVHDAKTDAQRETLFKEMRTGKKKIMIGSTDQCGTGVNAEMEQSGKTEVSRDVENAQEPEFREKLYDALMGCYQQERDKAMNQGMEQATSQSMERAESRQPDRNLPFR